jgi:AraC family L-rhamnose operon regulatory protein RhaS
MMRSSTIFKDFELSVKEYNSKKSMQHRHSFFEMIYVLKGSGVHLLNGNKYSYKKGDFFLLTPDDMHSFESLTVSTFCIIDFTKHFLMKTHRRDESNSGLNDFFKKTEYIFHNHNKIKGDLIVNEKDRVFIQILIDQLIFEKKNELSMRDSILQNIVFLLLNLVGRNIQQNLASNLNGTNRRIIIHEITYYIHEHIYDKELITVEQIASHFNKSKDYISIYFKKHTKSSLKEYIIQYKLNLVQTRLIYSDLTISEIAYELNFTDESHLNKTFRKMFGQTANQYRKLERDKKSY